MAICKEKTSQYGIFYLKDKCQFFKQVSQQDPQGTKTQEKYKPVYY